MEDAGSWNELLRRGSIAVRINLILKHVVLIDNNNNNMIMILMY